MGDISHALLQHIRRVAHNAFGPSRRERELAAAALAGRAYYELYDDRYRLLHELGVTDRSFLGFAEMRGEVHHIWDRLCQEGLLVGRASRLVDLGCGEGENAVHFAELGYEVTAVDISPAAIAAAANLASSRAARIDFRIDNVIELATLDDAAFDVAVDICCLHMLVRSAERHAYLTSIHRILRPGGSLFLFDRVARRDVTVADEERSILKSITLLDERRANDARTVIRSRGCGFRNASLRQYVAELSAARFEVRYTQDIGDGFAAIVATRSPTPERWMCHDGRGNNHT